MFWYTPYSHRIHVWYIYIYMPTWLGSIDGKCYHDHGIHTDPMGLKFPFIMLYPLPASRHRSSRWDSDAHVLNKAWRRELCVEQTPRPLETFQGGTPNHRKTMGKPWENHRFSHRKTPKWVVYKGKSYMDDDWGYPSFGKPPHRSYVSFFAEGMGLSDVASSPVLVVFIYIYIQYIYT